MFPYSKLANCIYFQSLKAVTFIYRNIFQGNNFPKQYYALKRFSGCFIARPKFQIFCIKSTMMVEISGIYVNANLVKSEAVIHRCRVGKNLFIRLDTQSVYSLKLFLKKSLLYRCLASSSSYSFLIIGDFNSEMTESAI